MPKKKKRPRKPDRSGRRRSRPSTSPHRMAPPSAEEEPDLLGDVRRRLQQEGPLSLLAYVSTLVDATDSRNADPFSPAQGAAVEGPDREQLVESFVDIDRPETTAMLAVLAELVDDGAVRRRLREALAQRSHPLPRWLAELAPVAAERAVILSHVLGDGDTVLVQARTGAGDVLTALVYIDHHFGTIVKDAFVVDAPVAEVQSQLREAVDDDPDTTFAELDLADARARIGEAIEAGAITYPPMETETWPGSRPLIEWLLRAMPAGGTGYVRPEWDEDARAELTERFFAAPVAAGHDAEDAQLLDSLLWFACDYGPGDPLRWSPTAVEILLLDWLPRKIIAEADFLARAPALLRSFVRFAHAEAGIRPGLTDETLAAIDAHEPAYLDTIRHPRPQGPAALLAAMGFDAGVSGGDVELPSHREMMLEPLRAAVGGDETLRTLDDAPLPDEAFDWAVVPSEASERVGEVVALVDRGCDALLDAECRTAARRLLADVAAADPDAVRRGRADTAAAALLWAVAKANDRFSAGGLTAKELQGWMGVSGSVSQRAVTLLRAIGVAPQASAGGLALGTARYLTGDRRRAIVERRERAEAMGD